MFGPIIFGAIVIPLTFIGTALGISWLFKFCFKPVLSVEDIHTVKCTDFMLRKFVDMYKNSNQKKRAEFHKIYGDEFISNSFNRVNFLDHVEFQEYKAQRGII